MAEKPKLKYRVVTSKKPGTSSGEIILRPVITERETYYIDQVVEYALNSGYIRGQFEDSKGTVNGFIEACKSLGKAGKAVNLANWLRIHAELTGTLGEERTLTDENEIHVNITALTDLKCKASEFSWENIDKPEFKLKITSACCIGEEPGIVKATKALGVYGSYLMYDSALGDKVEMYYPGRASVKPITPTESDYGHMVLPAQEELADLDNGTPVTYTFTLHGGIEGATPQVVTVTLIKAE